MSYVFLYDYRARVVSRYIPSNIFGKEEKKNSIRKKEKTNSTEGNISTKRSVSHMGIRR